MLRLMRNLHLFGAAALAVLVAAPASATQGLSCRTASGPRLELHLVLGARPSVLQPRLAIGGRRIPVVFGQHWMDGRDFWLDLYDPQLTKRELRLKVRRAGFAWDGSVWAGGTRRWVRCRES